MTRDEFIRLVETFGASESRWPENYKNEMLVFRAENAAEAEAIISREAELDQALETVRLEPGTDMLKARILSQLQSEEAANVPQPANSNRSSFGHKAVAALMLMAFTVGFAGASVLKMPSTDDGTLVGEAESDWEELAELAEDYGMDDIYEWVDTADASPAP